jgi:RNA polymerase sigma-70 factor, ECF subfamily
VGRGGDLVVVTVAPLERLFEEWYGRLVAAVRRRFGDGGDVDDAEDVAQEAFVRLLDEQPPENARAWLFTVAARLATDRHRAAARRRRITLHRGDGLDFGGSPSRVGDSADEAVERAETVAGVRAVLALLAERERQLLLLHHAGFSYREVAAQLGVAPASVGSLLTRAHRRFVSVYDERFKASQSESRSARP